MWTVSKHGVAIISLPVLPGNSIFICTFYCRWLVPSLSLVIWQQCVLNNGRIILCAAGFYMGVPSVKCPSLQILPILGARLMYAVAFFGLLYFFSKYFHSVFTKCEKLFTASRWIYFMHWFGDVPWKSSGCCGMMFFPPMCFSLFAVNFEYLHVLGK
jgi:hypothetical protein